MALLINLLGQMMRSRSYLDLSSKNRNLELSLF